MTNKLMSSLCIFTHNWYSIMYVSEEDYGGPYVKGGNFTILQSPRYH